MKLKKVMQYCLPMVALGLMLGAQAFAQGGNGAGNGGGAYVCINPTTNQPVSARSLDLWENEKWTLDLNLSGDETEIAEALIQKLSQIDPVGADKIRSTLKDYLAQVHFEDSRQLQKKNDANIAFRTLEPNCDLYTAAFFRNDADEMHYRYVIDGSIWKVMKPVDRAALLLHEVIYSIESKMGAKTSDGTREQIRMIFSNEFTSWPKSKVYEYMRKNSMGIASVRARNGVFYEAPYAPSFYPDSDVVQAGQLISGVAFDSSLHKGLKVLCRRITSFNSDGNPVSCGGMDFDILSPFKAHVNFVYGDFITDKASSIEIPTAHGTMTISPVSAREPIHFNYDSATGTVSQLSGRMVVSGAQIGNTTVNMQLRGIVSFYPSGKISAIHYSSWRSSPDTLSFRRREIVLPLGKRLKVNILRNLDVTYSESGILTSLKKTK